MTKQPTFSNFLASNIEVDKPIVTRPTEACRRIRLKKGDFALQTGDTFRHSFFMERGLLKQYTIDNKAMPYRFTDGAFDLPDMTECKIKEEGESLYGN